MKKIKFSIYLTLAIALFSIFPITNTTFHSTNIINQPSKKEIVRPLDDTDIGKIYYE